MPFVGYVIYLFDAEQYFLLLAVRDDAYSLIGDKL